MTPASYERERARPLLGTLVEIGVWRTLLTAGQTRLLSRLPLRVLECNALMEFFPPHDSQQRVGEFGSTTDLGNRLGANKFFWGTPHLPAVWNPRKTSEGVAIVRKVWVSAKKRNGGLFYLT